MEIEFEDYFVDFSRQDLIIINTILNDYLEISNELGNVLSSETITEISNKISKVISYADSVFGIE